MWPRNAHGRAHRSSARWGHVVGIAPRSSLFNIRAIPTPIIEADETEEVTEAINGAGQSYRVIAMAFGDWFTHSPIADAIRFQFNRTDRPGILFVGAAGSLGCSPIGGVTFPAWMDEVIAVTALHEDRVTVRSDSCTGAAVDLAPVIGVTDVETTARRPEDVIGLGASSSLTG